MKSEPGPPITRSVPPPLPKSGLSCGARPALGAHRIQRRSRPSKRSRPARPPTKWPITRRHKCNTAMGWLPATARPEPGARGAPDALRRDRGLRSSLDSPLEGDGFEPPVPRAISLRLRGEIRDAEVSDRLTAEPDGWVLQGRGGLNFGGCPKSGQSRIILGPSSCRPMDCPAAAALWHDFCVFSMHSVSGE